MKNFLLLLAIPWIAAAAPDHSPAQIQKLATPPKIDGTGGDWQIPPVIRRSSPDGKMEIRLGYDEENFFIFAEITDKSPLKNNADRPEEMIKGGDAVVFYFKTRESDEQRVVFSISQGKPVVYVSRPRSDKKMPYTYSSPVGKETFDYVAPLEGVRMVFGQSANGYKLEASIPWKQLGMQPPPSRFAFDAEVIFSDPAGSTNAGSLWWHASEGPGLTIEDLPTEAKLYPDTWGEAVLVADSPSATEPPVAKGREASAGNSSEQIEIVLPRDGRLSVNITDDKGWILRELVLAEKVQAGKFTVAWDGRDRYGEPLPSGNYQWKALLFDGMKADFMGSIGSSGRPPYRTPDGLGAIGGQHGPQKSVAADAGGVYMANALEEGQPSIRKINPQTGAAIWKRSAGGFKIGRHIAAGDGMACFLNVESKSNKNRMELVRIDPATGLDVPMGTVKGSKARVTLEEAPANGDFVQGLTIVGGKAYFSVPSENRIGAVDLNTGIVEKDITCKAVSPQGLARLDDRTLLVCSGKQIIAWDISNKTGRVLIDHLVEPRAVCADEKGLIYVSDLGACQQIKKFSPDGKPVAAFGVAGGRKETAIPFVPLAFLNIASLTIGPDGNLWLAELTSPPKRFIKMTPDGKWLEDFYGPVAYNTFGPDLDDLSRVFYNGGGNSLFVETKVDYDLYKKNPLDPAAAWNIVSIQDLGLGADGESRNPIMSDIADNGYGHVIAFQAANGKRYLFRMSKNNRASNPIAAGLWVWKIDRWIPSAFISRNSTKNSKIPQDDFSWADQNGDGLVQEEEKYREPATEEVAWIDRDLTLHGLTGKWSPSNISEAGAPKYQQSGFTPYLGQGETNFLGDSYNFVSAEDDGSVYYICNLGPHRHMSFWDRATENRLVKIKHGKVEWIAGRHATKPGPTDFTTASGIAGIVDGIVLVHNIEPANYVAYTEDGFVLGDVLLDETGEHPKVGGNVINIENFTGLFIKDPRTKKSVLFAVSSGDDRMIEISGPGKMTRMEGKLSIRSASSRGENQPMTIPYSNFYGNVLRGIGIDGEDTEWNPDVPAVSLVGNGEVIGDIRFRRDAGMLDVFVTVSDPASFEEGEGVEITLSKTEDPTKLVTLFLSASKNAKGEWIGKAVVTREGVPVDSGKIKVGVTSRWLNLGYRIEAAIPLELLPELVARMEQTVRFEGKSDKTGKTEIQTAKQNVNDLVSPLYGNIRIIRMSAGQPVDTRYSTQLTPILLP